MLSAVGEQPHLRLLLLRHDLQPILQNLVLLDWVVHANVAERLSSRPWVGETDVIGYVWERWMGDGQQRYARDLLLRTLAEREGEQLSGAAHRDTVRPEQLPLLAELADEGMLRVSGPSVRFSTICSGIGDVACACICGRRGHQGLDSSTVPRWGRAIRLYAQSLAEQGSGLASWKSASDQLSATDSQTQLARDLLLDGLLLAINSEALLEKTRNDLEDRGQVIRRLLKRLLHVETNPDWRIALLRGKEVADNHLGAWFRIPVPIYWYPVLRVLSRHSTDVVHNALSYAAEVCGLWLRTMPPGTLGRREAAALSLALGREMQALLVQDTSFQDSTKQIFEAALQAAPEFSDEVGQMALELAGRRPFPQRTVDRRKQWREQRAALQADSIKKNPERARQPPPPGTFLPFGGRMRPPSEDGPARRVPDDFQAAVLDGTAIQPLIAANPAIAREVLLAVCIEEPKREDPTTIGCS